jgi:hypothetical protein
MNMRGRRKVTEALATAIVLSVLTELVGCDCFGSEPEPQIAHRVVGVVRDVYTGQVVSGVTIGIHSHSTTSAADGSFLIDLGTRGGVETGEVSIIAANYQSLYSASIRVDAGNDAEIELFLPPCSSSTYPSHSLTGHVYELQTSLSVPTEIPDGSSIRFTILNEQGGSNGLRFPITVSSYSQATGYTIDTKTLGSHCIVSAMVFPSGGTVKPFTVIAEGVDLTDTFTPLTLTEDLAHTSVVRVTGESPGNLFQLNLVTPYGAIPAGFDYLGSTGTFDFAIANPLNFPAYWLQQRIDYPSAGWLRLAISTSALTITGADVALPPIGGTIGPTEPPDAASIAYSGGVLSVAPVAGAIQYGFSLHDNAANADVALISGESPSIRIPQWLLDKVSGRSIRVQLLVTDGAPADLPGLAESTMNNGLNPGKLVGVLVTAWAVDYKDVDF